LEYILKESIGFADELLVYDNSLVARAIGLLERAFTMMRNTRREIIFGK